MVVLACNSKTRKADKGGFHKFEASVISDQLRLSMRLCHKTKRNNEISCETLKTGSFRVHSCGSLVLLFY